jgi:hypothetical protein
MAVKRGMAMKIPARGRRDSRPVAEVLLQVAVKVLVRADGKRFDHVLLLIELVGEEELLGTDLELYDSNSFEGTRFGFSGKRIRNQGFDRFIHCQLSGCGQATL